MLKGNKKTMLPFSNGKVSWQAGEICDSLVSMIALHIAVTVCRMFSASPDSLSRPESEPSAKNPFSSQRRPAVACEILMFFAPLPLDRSSAPKQSLCGYVGMVAFLSGAVNTFFPFFGRLWKKWRLFVKDHQGTGKRREHSGENCFCKKSEKKSR